MKLRILTLSLLATCVSVAAQDEAETPASPWTTGGNTSLTFNQVALKNWSAGGKNSVAGTFLFKTFANYKTENATWDNTLDLGYGMTKYSGEDLQKTEDKLMLSSVYGYNAAANKLFYSASFDLNTQFAPGYSYDDDNERTLISNFFAPGYMTLSAGMLYKPNDVFSLYVSPLTGKTTIVCDTTLSVNYGLDEGSKCRWEYGAYVKLNLDKKDLLKNVDYYLHATLFSNLVDHPDHVDVDCETGFNFTINQYLTALI